MIRDRGRIKWNSLMLPEHVTMLRNWANEDNWENWSPLDEQKLEQLNDIAGNALELGEKVMVTYFVDKHYEQVVGQIQNFDALQQELQIITQEGRKQRVAIERIKELVLYR